MDHHTKTITELQPGPARFEYILTRLGEVFTRPIFLITIDRSA